MKNIYFVQVDVSSGKNSKVIYLPYTSGVIIANAFKNPAVRDNYDFKDFIFIRKNIEDVVSEMENPAVVGFSNYCWNTEYHLALAKEIKKMFEGIPEDNIKIFIDVLHQINQNIKRLSKEGE